MLGSHVVVILRQVLLARVPLLGVRQQIEGSRLLVLTKKYAEHNQYATL